jgi:hypothetical protein
MKRALIAIASVGILAPTAWVIGANAQYGSPPPGYGPAPTYNPSQAYNPSQRYDRRTYRRSAGQPSGGGLVYTPGSGPPPYDVPRQAYGGANQGPWEWHAAPGPSKRGSMCVKHTDALRGYGYHEPCPPPKKGAKK